MYLKLSSYLDCAIAREILGQFITKSYASTISSQTFTSPVAFTIVIREIQGNTSAENFNLLLLWNALVVVVNRIRSFQNEHSNWLCVKKFNKPSSLERFLIDCRKTKPRQSKWPITTKERTNENSKQLTFYRRYMRENLGDQDTKGLCLCGPL